MKKVLDFKAKVIESIQGFVENPECLPSLVHARYRPKAGDRHRKSGFLSFSQRKHKPHQMHRQHREAVACLLTLFVTRLDLKSRQCVFVNPKYNIWRTLYIDEMKRYLERHYAKVSRRTVVRCIDSLERAGYLYRKGYNFFLSLRLFNDVNRSIHFDLLVNKLNGLDGKPKSAPAGASYPKRSSRKDQGSSSAPGHQSYQGWQSRPEFKKTDTTLDAAKTAMETLARLGLRRRRPPPPD